MAEVAILEIISRHESADDTYVAILKVDGVHHFYVSAVQLAILLSN